LAQLRDWWEIRLAAAIVIGYAEAIRSITGADRTRDAEVRFRKFLVEMGIRPVTVYFHHPALRRRIGFERGLAEWEYEGLTQSELDYFREEYSAYLKKSL
jgi:hypothetical protein